MVEENNKENIQETTTTSTATPSSVGNQPTVNQEQQTRQATTTQPSENVQNSDNKNGGTAIWKSLITILFLIFFYPIGLILMFTITKWHMVIKIILSFILIIQIIIIGFYFVRYLNDAKMSKSREAAELDIECIKLCANGEVGQNYDVEEAISVCSIECNNN